MAITANGTHIIFNDSTTQATQGIEFASGTVMLFGQTAAPTGWTKNTTTGDNSALRVVTGTASTGGSVAFTTAFASQAVTITAVSGSAGATTLTTPQIPSHTHNSIQPPGVYGSPTNLFTSTIVQGPPGTSDRTPQPTASTGGGSSHNHPFSFSSATANAINLAVQYIDVIRATKD
jgi:hypothetical protein